MKGNGDSAKVMGHETGEAQGLLGGGDPQATSFRVGSQTLGVAEKVQLEIHRQSPLRVS